MQVKGEGHIEFFSAEDEGPHPAGPGEWWNESVWLQFAEPGTGLYGALRIGHQANYHGGMTSVWSMVGTPDLIYKRDGLFPLAPSDIVTNGFSANGTHRFEFDGRCNWTIEDEDISVHLVSTDFHKPLSFTPGMMMENIARNHLEAAGEIQGTIRIRDKTYEVRKGLSYRDHSWGIRYWHHIRVHRFTGASFGPDFSCNAISIYNETDQLMKWGYVRRGDTIIPAKNVDILTYLESDGVSNRGGVVRYYLADGEELVVELEPVDQGMVSRQHSFYINDTICWARCGDRVGTGVFETSNNVQGGTLMPTQRSLIRAIVDNGIQPATPPPTAMSSR